MASQITEGDDGLDPHRQRVPYLAVLGVDTECLYGHYRLRSETGRVGWSPTVSRVVEMRPELAAVRTNPRCGAWETPEIAPRLEKGVDGCVPEHPCGGLGDLAFVDSP